jgi:tRNA threonylcarbamoyladenosine biosynthesis protein TsaE
MGKPVVRLVTRSPEETHALGVSLARQLNPPCTVLLSGSLGAGKTALARGIAVGAGLDDPARVSSPSFALVNRYEGKVPIYHVDLYRLEGERDLASVGLEEFMDRSGITIVEWGERIELPMASAVRIAILDLGGDSREFTITGLADSSCHVLRA